MERFFGAFLLTCGAADVTLTVGGDRAPQGTQPNKIPVVVGLAVTQPNKTEPLILLGWAGALSARPCGSPFLRSPRPCGSGRGSFGGAGPPRAALRCGLAFGPLGGRLSVGVSPPAGGARGRGPRTPGEVTFSCYIFRGFCHKFRRV